MERLEEDLRYLESLTNEHSAVQNSLALIREIEDPEQRIQVAAALIDELNDEIQGAYRNNEPVEPVKFEDIVN